MAVGDWWHQAVADRPAVLDAAVGLDQLPLATLILAGDGTAVKANQAWAALAARAPGTEAGDGWPALLAPADRAAFVSSLCGAARAGEAGSAEVRLAGPGPERTSRWWWRPGPDGQLVVCVAELGGPVRRGPDEVLDVLALVVHRLFGIGLEVQSAAGVADGPVADRLQLVVDELDELIRDARSMAFERIRPREPGGLSLSPALSSAPALDTSGPVAPAGTFAVAGGVRSPRALSRTGRGAGSGPTAGAGT